MRRFIDVPVLAPALACAMLLAATAPPRPATAQTEDPAPAAGGAADSTARVLLRDGSVVVGSFAGSTADAIRIRTPEGTLREIPHADIERIEFAQPTPAGTPPPPQEPPGELPPAPGADPAAPSPEDGAEGAAPAPGPDAPAAPAAPDVPARPERGPRTDFDPPVSPVLVVNGFLGGKSLNREWEPVSAQAAIGVESTFLPVSAIPFGFAFDILGAGGSEYGRTAGTRDVLFQANLAEVGVGLRFLQELDPQVPLVLSAGGGGALVVASQETSRDGLTLTHDSDGGAGLWASAGMHLRALDVLNLGATIRWSSSTVTLFRNDIDPGGVTFAVTAGFTLGMPTQGPRRRVVHVAPAPPPSARGMWLQTPWGGNQWVAVGQWVWIERAGAPAISGRVRRLAPDAIQLHTGAALVWIPTDTILRINTR